MTTTKITPKKALEKIRWCYTKKKRKELEGIIAKSARCSYEYAKEALRDRFPLGEKAISGNAECSFFYAREVIKGRWKEGERSIRKDPIWASIYVERIIKKRWPEGERAIIKNSASCLSYAVAIGGRLPPPMHNAMILMGFDDDHDRVQKYLEFVKSKEDEIILHLSFLSEEERLELLRRAAIPETSRS